MTNHGSKTGDIDKITENGVSFVCQNVQFVDFFIGSAAYAINFCLFYIV